MTDTRDLYVVARAAKERTNRPHRQGRVTRLPVAMKRGPKVKRGPCAELLTFPGDWGMAAGRRLVAGMDAAVNNRAKYAALLERFHQDKADADRLGAKWS